ncbi:MAG: permease [Aquificaceae bacterium]|nr:permease [Aquificaceae bacterium]
MSVFLKFFQSFYDYTVDILPYFLLAVVITSILQGFTNLTWLRRALRDEKTAPVYTGIIAGILPLCSCSMLPVANLINGLSRTYAPVISFLVVAPVVSPLTLLLTYGYFGLPMTLLRLFGTLFFALLFAYLVVLFFKKPRFIPLTIGGGLENKGWKRFLDYFKENFLGIGKYLLLGIFIASLIKTIVPTSLIAPVTNSVLSYPLLSLFSIPIYVCSGEEVPIAKALEEIGFSKGSTFTFMLGGTGVCIPTVLATLKFLPRGLVATYLLFWVIFSMAMGAFYDFVFWKL